MITPEQIKKLQTLLSKRFSDREERLFFLSEVLKEPVSSVKDLTECQAFGIIRFLEKGKEFDCSFYARFEPKNSQHATVLARCYELGWVQEENPKYVDLNRLGGFLISKKSPVRKELMKMTKSEVSKIIFVLEKIIKGKYTKKS